MRERLSYANVVATLALFIALGGSSYAAVKITGKNVKDGSLTGQDIKNSSVTSRDVKNRSLLARDFRAGQLPAGAQGPRGTAGPQGPAGPSIAYHASGGQVSGVGTGGSTVATLNVPAGPYAVFARVNVFFGSATTTLLNCSLAVGASTDNTEEVTVPYSGANDYMDTLALTTTGTLPASGTVSVTCRAANGGETFNVGSSSITAVRAGSLGP